MKLILSIFVSCLLAHVSLADPLDFKLTPRHKFIDYSLTVENRNNFLEHFQSFIENIIEDATNFIKEYADKTAEIVAQIQSQIDGISSAATETFEKLKKDVDDLMVAWQDQSDWAVNCTHEYLQLNEEAANKTTLAILACIQNATEAANEINEALRPNIGQLLTYIKELETLVDECFANSTNVFQGISCVVGKGNEIKTNILQVVMDVKAIILTSTNKGFTLVTTTGKCLNTAFDEYQETAMKLRDEFKNCVLKGFW